MPWLQLQSALGLLVLVLAAWALSEILKTNVVVADLDLAFMAPEPAAAFVRHITTSAARAVFAATGVE